MKTIFFVRLYLLSNRHIVRVYFVLVLSIDRGRVRPLKMRSSAQGQRVSLGKLAQVPDKLGLRDPEKRRVIFPRRKYKRSTFEG